LQAGGNGAQAGGSIISTRHILTSGFVTTVNFVTYNIFYGGYTRNTQIPIGFSHVIRHAQYQANPRTFDIGIVVTNQDFIFSAAVWPVALPQFGGISVRPYLNEQGTISGFAGSGNPVSRK